MNYRKVTISYNLGGHLHRILVEDVELDNVDNVVFDNFLTEGCIL